MVKLIVRLVILAVCLVLLITGIANGGIASVLAKANKLCQECIGIG
ncbi:MAG: thioredoxin [Clostridia bacterium]|nr:thioredoxin [Clostridia bacterium]